LPGQVSSVQAPGTAKGKQSEVARVVAAFNGDYSEGTLHVSVSDFDDAQCGLSKCEAEFFSKRLDGSFSQIRIERYLATQETVGRNAA
jgi:hypothetical protein